MATDAEAHFEHTPDWLLVRMRGTMNAAWFVALIGRVAQAARDGPTAAILVDGREMVGSLSDMDRYDIGVAAALQRFGVPVAVVGTEPLIDPGRLGEIVARNRGVNVRAFTDYDAACAWLRGQATSAP
jgi:hypothetical protein